MSEKYKGLADKFSLKGDWLTNTNPALVTATPDGRGYTVLGSVYPEAVLGRPTISAGASELRITDKDSEAAGIVGLYKPFTFLRPLDQLKIYLKEDIEPLLPDDKERFQDNISVRNSGKEFLKKPLKESGGFLKDNISPKDWPSFNKYDLAATLTQRWLTNVQPRNIQATPDGKGYICHGKTYPNAVLGAPQDGLDISKVDNLSFDGLYQVTITELPAFSGKSLGAQGYVGVYERQP